MRTAVAAIFSGLVLLANAAITQAAGELEIRFCPSVQVRSFPLESRRGVQSLLLQNAAIINHTASSADVTDITLELLQDDSAVDTRRIAGGELTRAAGAGPLMRSHDALAGLPVLRIEHDRGGHHARRSDACAQSGAITGATALCVPRQARHAARQGSCPR